jgi:spore photoproduct lyase
MYTAKPKVSDFLVPYNLFRAAPAACLTAILCAITQMLLSAFFVNRRQMLEKLLKPRPRFAAGSDLESGSNSDHVMENTITGNL